MSVIYRKNNSSLKTAAGGFIGIGALLLAYAVFFEMQIAAFIGLGLVFWGAILALVRNGKYIDSTLLDGTAKSHYLTIDRMINDLKYSGQGYYIPAYPQDVFLPEYLQNLKEPVVFISESFDGKPSIDEIAAGKFLSTKTRGVFISSPGAGLLSQIERKLQWDFSKINLNELTSVLPKSITELFCLSKKAELILIPDGAVFKAEGVIYESFYSTKTTIKSVNLLGCPVVSLVASALAKTSGKTIIIKELTFTPGNNSVHTELKFVSSG